jgi:glycosyltransferase involved in cell wall biosynthesis
LRGQRFRIGNIPLTLSIVTDPVVSVVIPVFNRRHMVRAAIDSVLAATVPVEVIAVDDASTDDTWEVLRAVDDPRVKAVRMERNGGHSAARNRGLDVARGRYMKFLDSDDELVAEHLGAEIRALESGAEIAVSDWIEQDERGNRKVYQAPRFGDIVDDVLAGKAVVVTSGLYLRRPDWRFDAALRKIDDWDFFVQAALGALRIETVPGASFIYHHHGGPRVTAVSMLANARESQQVLHKIEERLAADGRLTAPRARRLAQYYYKELRVLCLNDPESFAREAAHIRALDPGFQPRDEEPQALMRAMARLAGFERAIRWHTAIKRAVKR